MNHTPTSIANLQASHNRMACTLRDLIEGLSAPVRKGCVRDEVLLERAKISAERAKDDLARAEPLCNVVNDELVDALRQMVAFAEETIGVPFNECIGFDLTRAALAKVQA